MMRRGKRIRLAGAAVAVLLGIALASAAAAADGSAEERCGWGPVNDVGAVRMLLREWAAATALPWFADDGWDVSIDHSSVWVRLQFARGTLALAWDLDEECAPTGIKIQASADYDGPRPDNAAVTQLVAGFGSVAVEQRNWPRRSGYPAQRRLRFTAPAAAVLAAVGVALAIVLVRLLRAALRVGAVATPDERTTWLQSRTPGVIRLLGVVAIVAVLPCESSPSVGGGAESWLQANALVLFGMLPLIAFLWLVLSGAFGFGSPRREDWPALLVFLLAIGIREGYARHAIEEIEIHFFYGLFPNRHSVVHSLFQMFLQPLARDPYLFMMHVNGVLGALAALPLYLFVRHRTESRTTAAVVATFYAAHPLIVQMAPTDGHYSLILVTWFGGLALLSDNEIDSRELFGGGVLLGIAATCRAEGSLYLLASLLLLDVRALYAAVRRHARAAALSAGVVLGLVAVHVYYCFPIHVPEGHQLPNIGIFTVRDVLRAGLLSEDFNDPIFVAFVLVGALAGLVNRRLRIGLGAALGTLVVVWPVCMNTAGGFTILHRLVPVCALQVIAAGVGASWLTSWLPPRLRHHWAATIPALGVAIYVFALHHREVRDPNAVTDEFWMLRHHLAPGGLVNTECTLLWFWGSMDTDIHDFGQVLPGMPSLHCDRDDCERSVSAGGCFYYVRSLNCYSGEGQMPAECLARGRMPSGDHAPCMDPRCVRLEGALELSTIEERTVDLYVVFRGVPEWPPRPRSVDIGLFRVLGLREAGAGRRRTR